MKLKLAKLGKTRDLTKRQFVGETVRFTTTISPILYKTLTYVVFENQLKANGIISSALSNYLKDYVPIVEEIEAGLKEQGLTQEEILTWLSGRR